MYFFFSGVPKSFTTSNTCEGPLATADGKLRGTAALSSNQRAPTVRLPASLPNAQRLAKKLLVRYHLTTRSTKLLVAMHLATSSLVTSSNAPCY